MDKVKAVWHGVKTAYQTVIDFIATFPQVALTISVVAVFVTWKWF